MMGPTSMASKQRTGSVNQNRIFGVFQNNAHHYPSDELCCVSNNQSSAVNNLWPWQITKCLSKITSHTYTQTTTRSDDSTRNGRRRAAKSGAMSGLPSIPEQASSSIRPQIDQPQPLQQDDVLNASYYSDMGYGAS